MHAFGTSPRGQDLRNGNVHEKALAQPVGNARMTTRRIYMSDAGQLCAAAIQSESAPA